MRPKRNVDPPELSPGDPSRHDAHMALVAEPDTGLLGDRHYGAKVVAVEPGGAEVIPLAERHGRPIQLLWTWTSPNMEFATDLRRRARHHLRAELLADRSPRSCSAPRSARCRTRVLSSWGPSTGFCQMVLSRRAFGYRGNILPAGINWLVAGVGWFAVNSVSGALALAALTGLNKYRQPGHRRRLHAGVGLLRAQPDPGVREVRRAGADRRSSWSAASCILTKADTRRPPARRSPARFWVLLAATFGYAAGWNPYASDYTRYLPAGTGRKAGIYAGLGVLVSCVLLETFGAAAFTVLGGGLSTATRPTATPACCRAGWASLTLLGIALGAIAANALNMYSSAISFAAMGIKLPTPSIRAVDRGGDVARRLRGGGDRPEQHRLLRELPAGDRLLGRALAGRGVRRSVATPIPHRRDGLHRPRTTRTGPARSPCSSAPWSRSGCSRPRQQYTGPVAKALPAIGDMTFVVGFLLAFGIYAALLKPLGRSDHSYAEQPAAVGDGRGST